MNRTLGRMILAVAGATFLTLLGETRSADNPTEGSPGLLAELKAYPHKLVYETNRDGNFELYLCNADGSNPVNLTHTPDVEELFPKPSPDGSKICFVSDEGKGDAKVRNLYHMNSDGSGRTKIAENAREPCWSPDGTRIAYLGGEFRHQLRGENGRTDVGCRTTQPAAGRAGVPLKLERPSYPVGLLQRMARRPFVLRVDRPEEVTRMIAIEPVVVVLVLNGIDSGR